MKKQFGLFSLSLMSAAIGIIQSCTKLERIDPPCPTIDSLSPNGAKLDATVSIKGKNFIPNAPLIYKINIGDTTITPLAAPDENTLQFKVPQGKTGVVTVTLQGSSNCTSNGKEFTYYYTGQTVDLFAGTVAVSNCTSPEQDCFSSPAGIDLDNEGDLIVADKLNQVIRVLAPSGKITYGKFKTPGCDPLVVNDAKFASFYNPSDVEVDAAGDIYVTEEFNSVIRVVKKNTGAPASAQIFAGKCQNSIISDGSCDVAFIGAPYGVSKNGNNVYFVDNGRLRLALGCVLSTLKTNGPSENFKGLEFSSARTGQDMIYVADAGNAVPGSIKAVDLNGNTIVLTSSTSGLSHPNALTLDSKGNIFITDGATNKIYVLYRNGYLATLAGSGNGTYMNGQAATAQFNGPSGLALDESKKILFVSDTKNHVIRKITFQ
jgi:hypothetical protein